MTSFGFLYDGINLFGWGNNHFGQLGFVNNNNKIQIPKFILRDKHIIEISCGESHTALLRINGEVMTCGLNDSGQLGLGDFHSRIQFESVVIDKKIVGVRCGNNYTLYWKTNGEIYVFGTNENGECGFGAPRWINKPQFLIKIPNIIDIKCGEENSLILTSNKLYVFGKNQETCKPNVIFSGDDAKQIQSIYCNSKQFFILKKDGTVLCKGDNYYGQLGLGTNEYVSKFTKMMCNPEIKKISLSPTHTGILKNNGKCLFCGSNYEGQLGFNTYQQKYLKPQYLESHCEIDNIKCINQCTIMSKNNSRMIYISGNTFKNGTGFSRNHFYSIFKSKYPMIIIGSGKRNINVFWNLKESHKYPKKFQKCLIFFLCCIKKKNIKQPKYILWKILSELEYFEYLD